MRQLIDKLILFLLCSVFFLFYFLKIASEPLLICVPLIAITLSCLQSIFHKQFLLATCTVIYLLTGCFLHPLFIYLPVFLYDIMKQKLLPLKIAGVIIAFLSLTFTNNYGAFFLICLYILSYWLQKLSLQLDLSEQKLIKLRDTSTENKLLLEEKNRAILENQTNQIYTATLKERNRIAREIHDNVGHLLTRSILQAGAVKAINKDTDLTPHLESLQETLNLAMTNIRSSVHDLHDEAVDLKLAIENLIKEVTALNITLEYSLEKSVPKEIKYNFLAIIKEAINNTVRHSNASKLGIYLIEHPAFYQLLIEDNGTGISKDFNSGIGLLNMEERVRSLKGTFQINTTNGFHIFISVMKEN